MCRPEKRIISRTKHVPIAFSPENSPFSWTKVFPAAEFVMKIRAGTASKSRSSY